MSYGIAAIVEHSGYWCPMPQFPANDPDVSIRDIVKYGESGSIGVVTGIVNQWGNWVIEVQPVWSSCEEWIVDSEYLHPDEVSLAAPIVRA